MAGLKDGDDFKDGEAFQSPSLLKLLCAVVGFGGLLLFFILSFSFGEEKTSAMGYSWLFAVIFFLTLGVGGLFWTLLHHASNSGWGTVVRRLMENLGSTIPFIMVLALPLVFPQFGFRDALWEWFPLRKAALEAAGEKAEKEAPAYIVEQEAKVKKAQKAVDKTRSELASLNSPSPGHKAYFERKIKGLEKEAAKLKEKDLSEDAVVAALTDKNFLKKEALLYVKRGYLNEGFWYSRVVFYFVVLIGIPWTIRRWSIIQDSDGNPKWFRWMRRGS